MFSGMMTKDGLSPRPTPSPGLQAPHTHHPQGGLGAQLAIAPTVINNNTGRSALRVVIPTTNPNLINRCDIMNNHGGGGDENIQVGAVY